MKKLCVAPRFPALSGPRCGGGILGLILGCFLFFPAMVISEDADLFTMTTEPDVLLIFDTSGSMTFDMYGSDADNYTWGDGSDYYPGRDSPNDPDTLRNDSRMYILKKALYGVVEKHKGIRFGLMSYGQYKNVNELSRGGPGGGGWYRTSPYTPAKTQKIPWHGINSAGQDYWPSSYPDASREILRAPMGLAGDPAHVGQIQQWLDQEQQILELRADGGTPIGGSLYWARQYYTQDVIPKDPVKRCRAYFVLLCSDGEETGYPTYNPRSPYTEATLLRNVQIAGIKYEVKTLVLGVAVGGGEGAKWLDSIAKLGGTEHYYPATTPEAIDSALATMLNIVEERATSFSGPEVPTVRTTYYSNIYIASFIPSAGPFWHGYLKAFRLNPDGTLQQDSLGHVLSDTLWEAGAELAEKLSSDRLIYTEKSNNRVAFTSANIDSVDLQVAGDSVAGLISWVRGDNGKDWKLEDIFHSWSVCVGPPSPWHYEEGYNEFKETHKHRSKVLIVGANDGMLHAFDAGSWVASADTFTDGIGEEKWAFIPGDLLPKLKNLRTAHGYYVDGNPVAFDAWFPSSSSDTTKDANEWKTMLICGERDGGNHYFSLDITDVHNPLFLWDFTDAKLGKSWSAPGVGKANVNGKERWIAVVGGGYNKSSGDTARAVYVLDATDGGIIKKFTNASMTYCVPSDPSLIDIIDINNDDLTDYVYIGDIQGQLWKADITSSTVSDWSIYRVFNSQQEQPFYCPPACAFDKEGHLWVFFGGGDRDDLRKTNTFNNFYGMRDNGQTSPYTDADLANVTTGGTANDNGWYFSLGKNEKCVSKPVVFGEVVYFTTYEPLSGTDPCEIQGIGRLYRVGFTSGKAREGEERAEATGEGVPMSPQISVTAEGDFVVTIGTSLGEIISERVTSPGPFKQIIYWRERKY